MKSFGLICLGLLLSAVLFAQVNTNNGNFYVSYGDLTLGKSGWELTRVYNSFSTDKDFFGQGWGSNLSTRLWPLPDGQLLLIHYGSGGEDLYVPSGLNRSGMYQMIDTIIEYEIKRNKIQRSPSDVVRRRSELVSDASKRASNYVKAIRTTGSACSVRAAPLSARWTNEYRELETIDWEQDAYHLKRPDEDYFFDGCGRLKRWRTKTDDIRFQYTVGGDLSFIHCEQDTAWVVMDGKGHISSIAKKSSKGQQKGAFYTYDQKGQLVRSVDVENNRYDYEYDRSSNMIFTRYENGTYRRMEYDPATNRTIGFRERNGDSSRFVYGYLFDAEGRLNPDHYYTRIVNYDSLGNRVFGTYSEVEFRYKENGENYRYRSFEKTDTSERLYVYPSNVGNVIYGKINDREAWQAYDAKTRPVYLRLYDSVYTTRYNVMDLPEQFQAIDSVKRDTVTYRYFYSLKGQLNRVTRNGVTYSIAGTIEMGKIVLTKDTAKWEIRFSQGNPTYFIDSKGGRLLVSELDKPEWAAEKKMFLYLLPLTKAQRIEHEWIWDRL